ncbi:MAG TPA: transcription-repair coupling factor [Pirellulales bacterium]|jgi:transcription-repair coupling factor (superfamily II helicase)|nr:transcription-repair coupling factor [Pirellulales bacterium]
MSVTESPSVERDQLWHLAGSVWDAEGFDAVVASLRAGHGATLDGVRGSSSALVAAALAEHCPATLVVVCAHPSDIDGFVDDLAVFSPRAAERFPAWESTAFENRLGDELCGDRLRVLKALHAPAAGRVVVTSIQSLLQPVPAAQRIEQLTRRLAAGETLDLEALVRWLVEQGFQNTTAVAMPGELSLRGGILDLFAPDWLDPVRIELFGDTIESIRSFEVSSQRSLEVLDHIDVTALAPTAEDRSHFAEHLPAGSWFLLVEPGEVEDEGRHYLDRVDHPAEFHTVNAALESVFRFPSVTAASLSITSLETTCRLKIETVERFSGDIAKVRQELDSAGLGQQVFIVCQTEAEIHRLGELCTDTQLARDGKLRFLLGRLRAGFRLVIERVVIISGGELFHRSDVARPTRRRLGRVIDSFLELREGDYVVHVSHGIGRYRGLRMLETEQHTEEHLELEFDGGTRLYVPVSKIELVQKYVGGSKTRPTLAKIGGRSWGRAKDAAEAAVIDLASEMLDLQAARASRPGIAFPPDSEWMKEFEASFPYQETPDQLTGIAAIRHDMQESRPMDRLICGDVGYGKTELAMRAAFKAVDAGYQVAVLVPTTVLAAQHGRTFRARMGEYPFRVEVLSRFCTESQQKQITAGMADGAVEIVIGTHRLAQGDVAFKNLGLLIIDEEQRFGVGVKERLKAYRHIVDVLTMTATPIPRTLHMSLLGLRDITNLETPPADRLAVETRVTRFDEEMIRHAILRELNREGQIFFVHNRIHDIDKVAWRLQQVVPEARICIGHGQMAEGELERVMLDFIERKYDVLLATTIIESGLDIPNANTIFIDDADQYGLADLHQLRGRVGRYKHRAYCYLLVDPRRSLTLNAAKRLTAIEEFSNMGAGFAIAMRDLEIRGAGNLLGTQQSGHIAAVGYELYCDLLEKTVRRLKHLPPKKSIDVNLAIPGQAYLPRRYVPDMRLKIDLYRRLARVTELSELSELRAELTDRFGPPPPEVERLLLRTEVAILAQEWSINSIHLEEKYLVLGYTSRPRIDELVKLRKGKLRVVDADSAYGTMSSAAIEPDAVLALAHGLLQPA